MKPDFTKLPEFYHNYVKLVEDENVLYALQSSKKTTIKRLSSIPEQNGDFRYDRGKWSIKELVNHMIDVERVFAYRALSFARNDKSELPGFDENNWAPASQADRRSLMVLIEEYGLVRDSTICLFESFTEEMLLREGKANNLLFNVLNIGYTIAGHDMHHCKILHERYMSS